MFVNLVVSSFRPSGSTGAKSGVEALFSHYCPKLTFLDIPQKFVHKLLKKLDIVIRSDGVLLQYNYISPEGFFCEMLGKHIRGPLIELNIFIPLK